MSSISFSDYERLVSACGWTTLATSSELSFYQKVSNREILLREITDLMLQFGATGVPPKGLNPYITEDAIEAAIVEYEFVLDVLDRLDINNTIDHTCTSELVNSRYSPRPMGREGPSGPWFYDEFVAKWGHLYGTSDHRSAFNKYMAQRSKCDVLSDYCTPRRAAKRDEAYKMCFELSYSTRAAEYRQRLNYECSLALRNGWYLVFDTVTLDPRHVASFANSPNAIRDYCRSIGRLVNQACGLAARESTVNTYKYFCVPEYGTQNGRLHFHLIHMMKALPLGSIDPNLAPVFRGGVSIRARREVGTLKGLWPYGFSTPIACRYSNDAYSRSGWLWPTDSKGTPIPNKPIIAVARYITKYITKNIELDKFNKLNPREVNSKWNKVITLQSLPRKAYRVRMSRGFGVIQAPMDSLNLDELIQLTNLPPKVTMYPRLLRRQAKRTLRKKLGGVSIKHVLAVRQPPVNLIVLLRNSIKNRGTSKELNFMDFLPPRLSVSDIFDSVFAFIKRYGLEYYDPKKQFAVSSK